MSEEDKNFDEAGAGALTDHAIRRILLARADAVEQAKFEALLMLDDGFEKRVQRLELELADDFSFGKLSPEEQQLFTSRFLVTPGRVRQLAVSKALRQVISSKSTNRTRAAGQHWGRSFVNFFAFDRPLTSAALGGVAVLIFGALFWLSLRSPPLRPPGISTRQKPAPSPDRQYAHPVVSPNPNNTSTNNPGAQQQVSTFTLEPESRSESKQTVQIPQAGLAGIRLELLVAVGVAPGTTYEAKLMSADELQVATFSDLRAQPADQSKVVLDLQGHNLKSGDYLIELRRISEAGTQEAERYRFAFKE